MSIRLQIYTPYFAPNVGGIERHVETVSGELHRRGVDVSVTCLDLLPGGLKRPLDDPSYRPDSVNGVPVRYLATRNLARSIYWPAPLIDEQPPPDLIHVHGVTNPEKLRLLTSPPKVPSLLTPHGSFLARYPDTRAWLRRVKRFIDPVLNSRTVRLFDRVIAISERERVALASLRPRRPPLLLPNPLDADDFVVAPELPGSSRRFLFLGRLHPEKRVEDLLNAAAQLGEDTPIDIAGPDDGMRAPLRTLATALGLRNVRFLPAVSGDEKRSLLRRALALVAPGEFEVYPLVCLEALAQGTPVIVPSSIAQGLPAGAAISYPDRDTSSLAAVLNQVEGANSLRLRSAAEAAGRSIAQIEQYTDELIAIYESVLAEHR
jgi:glycosyltransferase involved in cell wall biosynthesis